MPNVISIVTNARVVQQFADTASRERNKLNMRIRWHEWTVVPDFHEFGHGVHFHDIEKNRDCSLVAFLDSYEWLHGNPPEVVINCIKPDAITTQKVLDAMKVKVEQLVRSKNIPADMITHRIRAIANG